MTFTAEQIAEALTACWSEESVDHTLNREVVPVVVRVVFDCPAMLTLIHFAQESPIPYASELMMFSAGLEVGRRLQAARELEAMR